LKQGAVSSYLCDALITILKAKKRSKHTCISSCRSFRKYILEKVNCRKAAANKVKKKENSKKKQGEELAAKKAELLLELQSIMAEYETGGEWLQLISIN
jgi:site-specific recombinase XerD